MDTHKLMSMCSLNVVLRSSHLAFFSVVTLQTEKKAALC